VRTSIINRTDMRGRGDNPGLILQRYLVCQSDSAERRALLGAAVQSAQSESLRAIYAEAFARWVKSFAEDNSHRSKQLTTASRLIIGLGEENVLETGLRLHHTYGTPIVPGSALKGLASHYCHDLWGQRHNDAAPEENRLFRRGEAHHSLLFGTTDDGGVITFHDALITPATLNGSALHLDVMTPHHSKWQTNEAPPTDFDSPVPVSFLSVTGTFDVRLSWAGPQTIPSDQKGAWTTLAMKILEEALAEWGVGGKTNSGYGRLVPSDTLPPDRKRAVAVRAKQIALPIPGEVVDAQLLEERTKKGGWKAIHEPSGLSGPIQNSGDVPSDKNAGDALRLLVASANEHELAFRFPTRPHEEAVQRTPRNRKGGRRD
jgi:CRISPR-associated protein Cmr6